MLHSATRSHIAIAGTIAAITPLTVAKGASAHDGHYEIDHAEDSEATGEPSDLPSESAATEETPPEQSLDISIDNNAAIQEASAVQMTAPTTDTRLLYSYMWWFDLQGMTTLYPLRCESSAYALAL